MKIFCIGRNYADHAKELNNPIPEEPVIFMKPPTALTRDNQPFFVPDFSTDVHHEVELVLRISKNGKAVHTEYAHNYYDAIGLGIDFTARDIQSVCKTKGLPWEKAKAFDGSAVVSPFLSLKEVNHPISFALMKNGEVAQSGNSSDMLFDFNSLIVHISRYFTLQKGDLIYTGTPAGVGRVNIGDVLEGYIQDRKMFECKIK
jgi:acylpyruvate hydrolase